MKRPSNTISKKSCRQQAFHLACRSADKGLIEFLLKSTDRQKIAATTIQTGIRQSIRTRNTKQIPLLLKKAKPNLACIREAAKHGNVLFIKDALNNGYNLKYNLILEAIWSKKIRMVKFAIVLAKKKYGNIDWNNQFRKIKQEKLAYPYKLATPIIGWALEYYPLALLLIDKEEPIKATDVTTINVLLDCTCNAISQKNKENNSNWLMGKVFYAGRYNYMSYTPLLMLWKQKKKAGFQIPELSRQHCIEGINMGKFRDSRKLEVLKFRHTYLDEGWLEIVRSMEAYHKQPWYKLIHKTDDTELSITVATCLKNYLKDGDWEEVVRPNQKLLETSSSELMHKLWARLLWEQQNKDGSTKLYWECTTDTLILEIVGMLTKLGLKISDLKPKISNEKDVKAEFDILNYLTKFEEMKSQKLTVEEGLVLG